MIIRLFLTSWFIFQSSVYNPISQYIEDTENAGGYVPPFEFMQNYYPSALSNGQPNKPLVLVMIKGSTDIEQFDNIPGVYMIPPSRYSQPLTSGMRKKFQAVSDSFGVPSALIDSATTQGEAITAVMRYLEPASTGLPLDFTTDNDALFE